MKRWAAGILAVLFLLAGTAGAEGRVLKISQEADGEAWTAFLESVGDVENSTAIGNGVAQLLQKISIEMQWDADKGVNVSILADGDVIMTETERREADGVALRSSTWPGVVIVAEMDPETMDLRLDPEEVRTALQPSAEEKTLFWDWAGTLEETVEEGSFMGDAYNGGSLRRTFRADDRDLAVLVRALLEMNPALAALAEKTVGTQELNSLLGSLALKNPGRYQLSLVYDHDDPQGLSLTVWQQGEQVATLSLGTEGDQNARAVLGAGLLGEVFYLDVGADWTMDGDALKVNGQWSLYRDPDQTGFASARTEAEHLLVSGTVTAEVTVKETEISYQADTTLSLPGQQPLHLAAEGKADGAAHTWQHTERLTAGESTAPMLVVTCTLEPGELPEDTLVSDSEVRIPMDEEGAWLQDPRLTAAIQQGTQDLSLQIFRILPAELLVRVLTP